MRRLRSVSAIFFYLLACPACGVIPLDNFYPYGGTHADSRVPTNDDGSSPRIPISTLFPYFNQQFSSLFVNTNGAISFDQTLSTFTPSGFPLSDNRKIIAPYWCDIDTRKGGDVWFYETVETTLLSKASEDIRKIFPDQVNFEAAWLFVATWDNVAFYGASSIGQQWRNTFQSILITNGRHSFTIFLYNKIQWTTGTASGGNANTGLGGTPAQVGFDAGDGNNFKAINESRTNAVISIPLLSNIDIPGKFVYRIDTETVKDGGCSNSTGGTLTIFPRYGTMFGGTTLSVGGPCVDLTDTPSIQFANVPYRIPCTIYSIYSVHCVTPMVYRTGDEIVTLYITHTNGWISSFTGIYTFINPVNTKTAVYLLNADMLKVGEHATISWDNLPFEADTLSIRQFQLKNNVNGTLALEPEKYVGTRIAYSQYNHTFILSTTGQAVIFCIHQDLDNSNSMPQITDVHTQPSVWSGIFIVRQSNIKDILNACYNWQALDRTKQSIEFGQIEPCPCTLMQARLDISRFNPDPECNSMKKSLSNDDNKSTNCIYQMNARDCIRMAFPGQIGYDNQCCYNKDGNLIETDTRTAGGTAHRYHYKGGTDDNIPYLSNVYNDMVPYMYCCQYIALQKDIKVDSCDSFLKRRPPSRCEGYIPPRPASSIGDPHLVTLDGLGYTFNGVGEYTLLQSRDGNVTLQARMEQFKDNNGQAKPASVITSVALQCGKESDIVEVRLNEIRLCDVLINGQQLDFLVSSTADVKGSTIINSRSNNSNVDSIWTAITCRQPNLALNVTAITKMINLNIVVADMALRGLTSGLLGNFNGIKDDDFTNANGQVVPSNSSLDVIHHQFGLTWQTHASRSLFTYPVGKTHQTFIQENFRPIFNIHEQCSANVGIMCGNDDACRFDLCTTNDTTVAKSTRMMTEVIKEMAEVALPACGVPMNVSNGYWNFTGQLANLLCTTNYLPNGPTHIYCTDGGQWSTLNTTCELKPCEDIQPVLFGKWNITNRSADLLCDDNYTLTEHINSICFENGTWNIPAKASTTCERIECDSPSNVPNGVWNKNGRYAELHCNEHYTLIGSKTLYCFNNGTWERISASCYLQPCEDLQDVLYGTWNISYRSANLVCNDNYVLTEEVNILCLDNGTWNIPTNISCQRLECDSPDTVSHGTWNKTGRYAELSCDENYMLNGSNSLNCYNNGTWESVKASCYLQRQPKTEDRNIVIKIVLPITALLIGTCLAVVLIIRRKRKVLHVEDNKKYKLVTKERIEVKQVFPVYYNTTM